MRLFWKIIILCILIAIVIFFVLTQKSVVQNKENDIVSDQEIKDILRKNKDASEYLDLYEKTNVKERVILSKEDILAGQQGETFKEIYEGLSLDDNKYMRVQLINEKGDRGIVSTIDLVKKEPVYVFGVILLGVDQNSFQPWKNMLKKE